MSCMYNSTHMHMLKTARVDAERCSLLFWPRHFLNTFRAMKMEPIIESDPDILGRIAVAFAKL